MLGTKEALRQCQNLVACFFGMKTSFVTSSLSRFSSQIRCSICQILMLKEKPFSVCDKTVSKSPSISQSLDLSASELNHYSFLLFTLSKSGIGACQMRVFILMMSWHG